MFTLTLKQAKNNGILNGKSQILNEVNGILITTKVDLVVVL